MYIVFTDSYGGRTALDATNQQKILGYFIEEAKEHMETLEEGIIELSSMANDPERVNEMFRAAHSVKGGAAMLGYTSIQKTAHRLEDAFKILKENHIEADRQLESCFFDCYDVLKDLLEKLQSSYGLSSEQGDQLVASAEPKFVKLQNYLEQLLVSSGKPAEVSAPEKSVAARESVLSEFSNRVKSVLRKMLQIFKQKSTPENRQHLLQLCASLSKLAPESEGWQTLVQTAQKAIANPIYSYQLLAPVVIKELKQGSDLIVLSQAEKIAPSDNLKKLADGPLPQILIPVDPDEAAKTLRKTFNKQQLSRLVQLLTLQ